MGKLLKYELLGNFRKSFPVIFAGILLNLLLLIYNRENVFVYTPFTVLIWIVVGVVIFIDVFNSYKNEMYTSKGYLTFTLPVSSKMIVLSKVLAAFLVSIIGGALFSIFMISVSGSKEVFQFIREQDINFLLVICHSLVQNIVTLLLIYLIICITKISAINGKIGGFIGVILFIASSIGIGYIRSFIARVSFLDINIVNSVEYGSFNMTINGSGNLNTGVLIFNIILIIVMFLGNSYLLDNEVNI